MGLEGLTAVESRIAQIQSLFTSSSAKSLTATTPSTSSSTTDQTGSMFDNLLSQVNDQLATTTNRLSATNLTPQTGATGATGMSTGRGAQYTQFATDVLQGIGAPNTAENVKALKAWALAEGTKATFNPLATTRRHANTTDFNSVGVKNYASYDDGVAATIETLKNGRYANVLAAFAQGDSAERVATAVANSPWGTGQGVLRVLRAGGL